MAIMKLLQCYSKGDRRFSALYARLGSGHYIENVYQTSKRNEQKEPYTGKLKGIRPAYLYFNGQCNPCTNEIRHLYYTMLWECYFRESGYALLEHATTYDGFYEYYPAQAFYPGKLDPTTFILKEQSCNQAFSIAWLVGVYKGNVDPPCYPLEICHAFDGYWERYHTPTL